jgi:hypothetical protein
MFTCSPFWFMSQWMWSEAHTINPSLINNQARTRDPSKKSTADHVNIYLHLFAFRNILGERRWKSSFRDRPKQFHE